MESKDTFGNGFQVAAARASKGFLKNNVFSRQRPTQLHPFLSPQLGQSAAGLRCDQAACALGIGTSWPSAASSLGAGRSSSCGPPGLRWGLGFTVRSSAESVVRGQVRGALWHL